jgi:hypothetical protein
LLTVDPLKELFFIDKNSFAKANQSSRFLQIIALRIEDHPTERSNCESRMSFGELIDVEQGLL